MANVDLLADHGSNINVVFKDSHILNNTASNTNNRGGKMKDKVKEQIKESSDQTDTESDVSRREFLTKSTGTIAAAGVMAAGTTLLSEEAKATWPTSSDASIPSDVMPVVDVDPAERFRIRQGDLFYEKHGFTDRDVTGWKGRYQYGVTIGIIQLPANIPMLPGDMGNASTFPFPVLYEVIPDIDPFWVLSDKPHPEVLKRTIIAAHRLEMQGCRAVIGNCGFFANYQPEVSRAITIPFYNGALMQLPMVLTAVGSNKKVGVLTANAKLLIPSPAIVEMYDPLGHFVYFESHGGFSYESGRKRNTAQATSSRTRS